MALVPRLGLVPDVSFVLPHSSPLSASGADSQGEAKVWLFQSGMGLPMALVLRLGLLADQHMHLNFVVLIFIY